MKITHHHIAALDARRRLLGWSWRELARFARIPTATLHAIRHGTFQESGQLGRALLAVGIDPTSEVLALEPVACRLFLQAMKEGRTADVVASLTLVLRK